MRGDRMKFPILGFGQTTQQETSQNREGLTTEEAVALAEQRIAFLETELARGGLRRPNKSRANVGA